MIEGCDTAGPLEFSWRGRIGLECTGTVAGVAGAAVIVGVEGAGAGATGWGAGAGVAFGTGTMKSLSPEAATVWLEPFWVTMTLFPSRWNWMVAVCARADTAVKSRQARVTWIFMGLC